MLINGERALAYIVEVDEIRPIPNYDRVEHARVGGWWVIVSKNDNIKPGDRCVYFEVDSLCPGNDERFKFLEKRHYKVKTLKMCGVYSQGLLMPVSLFPELDGVEKGTDVTKTLNITYADAVDARRKAPSMDKYKLMAKRHPMVFKKPFVRHLMKYGFGKRILFFIFGSKKKDTNQAFPSFVSKTDEERCVAAGTWVTTDRGTFKIEDIVNNQMDVQVLCTDQYGRPEYKHILSYQSYSRQKTIKITFDKRIYSSDCLYCTPTHKILTDKGWKLAAEVGFGDSLMTIIKREFNGELIKELAPVPIRMISNGKEVKVYDLEIEDNHNFLTNGIISHNCENMPWIINDTDKEWICTEKLDGTSTTFALERKGKKKFEFYVCSRNCRLADESAQTYHTHNIYWEMAKKYDVERHLREWLESHPDEKWVCIQGESVGSVQGNPLKLDEDDLYIFNFINSEQGRISSYEGKTIIESWGMKWVPILGTEKLPPDMETLKQHADGVSAVNQKVKREGIVYRSLDGQQSFKNVSRTYLLSKKE